jgi:hypothetical protein
VAPPVPPNAIIVVGDVDSPTTGELEMEQVLERAFDFELIAFADDSEKASSFGPALVIISSSVDPDTVVDEWADEPLPVIVMNHEVFAAMGMTGDGPDDHGLTSAGTILQIEDGNHPVVAGLVFLDEIRASGHVLAFGRPGGDGRVILSAGARNRGAIFAYEHGDELAVDGLTAGHRRLGLFVQEASIADMSSTEETLLYHTLLFAWSGPRSGALDGQP